MSVGHMQVYGADHSPWVQAVLLGLHERGVSHDLVTVPPWEVLRQWGVLMPAARIDGGSWGVQSQQILQTLGFEPLAREDLLGVQAAWQGVMHRPDSAWRFWSGFSRIREPGGGLPVRLARAYRRSFSTLYFYLLIRSVVISGKLGPDPENFGDQFLTWEHRLAEGGPFLGGSSHASLHYQ